MSHRARAYLLILASRHLSVGALALAIPDTFDTGSYQPIRELMPLPHWAALFIVIGAAAAIAALIGQEAYARTAIVASVALTAAWAALFISAGIAGDLTSPIPPVIWSALVGKDLVVAAMPLRSPFEDLLRIEAGGDDR